jgi:lipopolysaccharide/colanic/teichoic acid biosynthesis glycosyltransferase
MRKQFLQNTFEKSFLPALEVLSNFREEVSLYQSPVSSRDYLYKRAFDIVFAAIFLLLAAPLMLLIALFVKMDSKGPVFYSQTRVGLNRRRSGERRQMSRLQKAVSQDRRQARNSYGRVFQVLKFRTMSVNAESNGQPVWCQRNDPRVTRVGNILRKTHLDELPQLINVLMGDMSIVGPRPERPEFVSRLREIVPNYEERLKLKPGLTGLAQIRHRADEAVTDVKKKVRYDLLYLKNASCWTDMKIVVGTLPLALGLSSEQMKKSYESERIKADKNLFQKSVIN